MKKTIAAILAITILLSSIASAGFLEILFGQAGITGQPMAVEKSIGMNKMPSPNPMYGGFKGSVSKGMKLMHGKEMQLEKGVIAKSSYNEKEKTATITFSKTLTVSNNMMLRLDDGTYTITMKNMPMETNGIMIQRKGKGIVSSSYMDMKSLTMRHMLGDKAFLAFGKKTQLVNGFSAVAEKSVNGKSKLTIMKTIMLKDGEDIALTGEKLGVSMDGSYLTFHTPKSATMNPKGIAIPNDENKY